MGLMVMQDMPSMVQEFYDPKRDPDVTPMEFDPFLQLSDANRIEICAMADKVRDRIDPEDQAEFNRQLAILVEQHKSYPSIIAWVSRSVIGCIVATDGT